MTSYVSSGLSDGSGREIRTTTTVRKQFRELILNNQIPRFSSLPLDQRKISNEDLSKFIGMVYNYSEGEDSHHFISNKDNHLIEIKASISPSIYKHFFSVKRGQYLDIIKIADPKPTRKKRDTSFFKDKEKYKHVVHYSNLLEELKMKKFAQDKPSEQKLISVHPAARQLLTQVVSKLGINVPREIGPIEQIYVGQGKNSNVVGFTTSDPNSIYVDIKNFGAKVSGLGLSPSDALNFFSGIKNKENAAEEIIVKLNALKYIIEFASIPIHERGHNPVGSGTDVIYDEGKAQAVENNAETRMANAGLKFIKELIDTSQDVNSVKPAFDDVAGRYRSSIPQYRTAFVKRRNLVKVSRMIKNISNSEYSYELNKILNRYDKKVKK